eukprot:CAMPEP_0172599988 /NCGR_PEP_ID=MMETSP1068-20121228/20111_1 /TAXON_ID=35684 /ORGANISM="Pseudopedinella elastica, Strain CCMP716" /LENGTH=704 /DNA_ID=CAMNT_0013400427 /DNA_START=81 /DNA_END=2195 /DNA_ORIENTATION=+
MRSRSVALATTLLVGFFADFGGSKVTDPSGVAIQIMVPAAGEALEEEVGVDLHVDFGQGPVADAVRADPDSYEVCYTGGVMIHCMNLGTGGQDVKVHNIFETQTIDHDHPRMKRIMAMVKNLPPDVRVSASGGVKLDYTKVLPEEDGLAAVRAWVAHVDQPQVHTSALGPSAVSFLWRDPALASRALRRRSQKLERFGPTCAQLLLEAALAEKGDHGRHSDDAGGGEGGGGSGGESGGGKRAATEGGARAAEIVRERGRLQFHLGLSLLEQLDQMLGAASSRAGAAHPGNATRKAAAGPGLFAALGMAAVLADAAEALARAGECGEPGAEEELLRAKAKLRALAAPAPEAAPEASETSETSETSEAPFGGGGHRNLGVETARALLSERVALVTLSNAGYADYTLNALVSLRRCGLPCTLQVVCIDEGCVELVAQEANRGCDLGRGGDMKVHLASTLLDGKAAFGRRLSEGKGEQPSAFASYGSDSFNAIVQYKFAAIHHFLKRRDFVIFTDGDVVFLQHDFVLDALAALGGGVLGAKDDSWPLNNALGKEAPGSSSSSSSSGFVEMPAGIEFSAVDVAAMCDAGHEEARCSFQRERYETMALCGGFMAIRSTAAVRALFDPEQVFKDARYRSNFEDQQYLNHVLAEQLYTLGRRTTTLNRTLFPNGAFRRGPLFEAGAATMIHFNFNTGHDKRREMRESGYWFA